MIFKLSIIGIDKDIHGAYWNKKRDCLEVDIQGVGDLLSLVRQSGHSITVNSDVITISIEKKEEKSERERCLKIVKETMSFPKEMPDEVWNNIKKWVNGNDKKSMTAFTKMMINSTKAYIAEGIKNVPEEQKNKPIK